MVRARRRKPVIGGSGVNKKLPLKKSIPLGIQHVLAMFAGNITVPIIVAGVFGSTTAEKIFLIQMALFVAGVATIIQTVGIGKIASADWFAMPMPVQYGIDFVWGAVILMLFMSIVTTIETIGDISATTMGGANREATDKELSGGIMADGLGTTFASIFNAMPNTSYSQNAGLVAFTGVISRHVGTVAGVILVLLGLFPKLGGIIAAMPESVIGGAAIIMFGLITAAGIKLIAQSEMSQKNLLILALSLSFGIGLSLLPQFVAHIPDFGIQFKLLLTTGLIPAGLLAFILNATLPKK